MASHTFPVLRCKFQCGTIPKKIIEHMTELNSNNICTLRFDERYLTIYTPSSQCDVFFVWRIERMKVNMEWLSEDFGEEVKSDGKKETRYVEFDMDLKEMKESLKAFKKNMPLTLTIFKDGENSFHINNQIGNSTETTTRSNEHIIQLKDVRYDINSVLKTYKQPYKLFLSISDIKMDMARFKGKELFLKVYENGIAPIVRSVGNKFTSNSVYGTITEDERDDAISLINDKDKLMDESLLLRGSDALQKFVKIEDGPLYIFYEENVSLTFVAYPGCYGTMYLRFGLGGDRK